MYVQGRSGPGAPMGSTGGMGRPMGMHAPPMGGGGYSGQGHMMYSGSGQGGYNPNIMQPGGPPAMGGYNPQGQGPMGYNPQGQMGYHPQGQMGYHPRVRWECLLDNRHIARCYSFKDSPATKALNAWCVVCSSL